MLQQLRCIGVRGKQQEFHSAESPQKTIAPHLAFNPRGSLEHKRFVYLVHGACSPSCLASLQLDLYLYMYAPAACSTNTLPPTSSPRHCKENAFFDQTFIGAAESSAPRPEAQTGELREADAGNIYLDHLQRPRVWMAIARMPP